MVRWPRHPDKRSRMVAGVGRAAVDAALEAVGASGWPLQNGWIIGVGWVCGGRESGGEGGQEAAWLIRRCQTQ